MGGILSGNSNLHNYWYVVARSADLTLAPAKITLLSRDVVLWRDGDGKVNAAPDRCPHREAPLSNGTIENGCLVCPYHGWTFDSGGKCVKIPSSAQGVPAPPKARLSLYPCTERYGLIWVCIGEPAQEIPYINQDDDPKFRRINTKVQIWKTSATRMVDNFLDITHFPFVHVGTFGIRQDTVVPKVDLRQINDSWYGYSYEVDARNEGGATAASASADLIVHRQMSSGFNLPFNVRSTIKYSSGLEHILLLISTPIDDVNSYFNFVVWRNDDFSINAEEIIRFDYAIGAEDKRMLETVAGVLPLGQTGVVSVQADKCNVEWRRRLAEVMELKF